eukprot:5472124-Pyramimonas_sp.AAC.1
MQSDRGIGSRSVRGGYPNVLCVRWMFFCAPWGEYPWMFCVLGQRRVSCSSGMFFWPRSDCTSGRALCFKRKFGVITCSSL